MRSFVLATVAFLVSLPIGAADIACDRGSFVDRTGGESASLERRREWFESRRRPGAEGRARELRAAAIDAAKKRMPVRNSGAPTWQSRGPSPSNFGGWKFGRVAGRITAFAKDTTAGVLYLGSASGGLWKSLDDGESWQAIFDDVGSLTIGAIALDPSHPSTIWAGTGDNKLYWCDDYFGLGLYRSTDGGTSWQARNGARGELDDLSTIGAIVVDPRDSNHVILGGRVAGCSQGASIFGSLLTTDDGGESWQERLPGAGITAIVAEPGDPDHLWAGAANGGLYRSLDGGATWELQTGSRLPTGQVDTVAIAVAPSDPKWVYVLFSSVKGTPELWRTSDRGESWIKVASGMLACDGQCWYNLALAVHPTDPARLYRGTILAFRSDDGGANWTSLTGVWGDRQKVHQDTHVVWVDPADPLSIYVGSDGGLWKTSDGGATFHDRNADLSLTQFYAIAIHPTDDGTLLGGAQDNSSLARTTSDVWDLAEATGDGFVSAFSLENPLTTYVASYPWGVGGGTYPGLMRSRQGVAGPYTWITGDRSGISGAESANWVTPYALDPDDSDILWLGTQRLYRSSNAGTSWTPIGPQRLAEGQETVLALDVRGARVAAGTTDGRVWLSVDSGETWKEISHGLPPRQITDLAFEADNLWCTVGGFNTAHLFQYRPEQGWQARGEGLPNVSANTVTVVASGDVYVGNDIGVFRSTDGGATVEPFLDGLPLGAVVADLKFNAVTGTLTAGTFGRGAWQAAIDASGPRLRLEAASRRETRGDGDDRIEPGERWTFDLRLRNSGDRAADAVVAGLANRDPRITIAPETGVAFGSIAPGAVADAAAPIEIGFSERLACGSVLDFDLFGSPNLHQAAALSVELIDRRAPALPVVLFADDFDAGLDSSWSHRAEPTHLIGCAGDAAIDEWHLVSDSSVSGNALHCGQGAGGKYSGGQNAWLYLGGRESDGGEGIEIPRFASAVALDFEHRYDTSWWASGLGWDGGVVMIDAVGDGTDAYVPLIPVEGYSGSLLAGYCNGLQGLQAFGGNGRAWHAARFDLTRYAGQRIHLAFAFGSTNCSRCGEGWSIDQVRITASVDGAAICRRVDETPSEPIEPEAE